MKDILNNYVIRTKNRRGRCRKAKHRRERHENEENDITTFELNINDVTDK